MARKHKEDGAVPNPSAVPNRDLFQRLNFLHQTSMYLAQLSVSHQRIPKKSTHPPPPPRDDDDFIKLSRLHTRSMKIIGQKAQIRMDPNVKRTICKSCQTILISGVTSKVRVHGSSIHGHLIRNICLRCNTSRTIPAPPLPRDEPSTNGTLQNASEDSANIEVQDTQQPSAEVKTSRKQRSRKRRPKPRPPPLFEREGHVVFRGNQRLDAS